MQWIPIAVVASEYAIRIVLTAFILVRRRHTPEVRWAWILLVVALPVVSVVLYVLLGDNTLGRRRIERRSRIQDDFSEWAQDAHRTHDVNPDSLHQDERQMAALAARTSGAKVTAGNAVELIGEPETFVQRLIDDIDAAQQSVELLFFIIAPDAWGERVGEALIRAAERGVTCRVLADDVGSRRFLRSPLVRRLRLAGVRVRGALPANLIRRRFERIDIRNHRKIVLIDGAIGYTGSFNLIAPDPKGRGGAYVDAMARLRGPAVIDLQAIFWEDWRLETDDPWDEVVHPVDGDPRDDGVNAQIVPTGPQSFNDAMKWLLQSALHTADDEVVLTSPYFIPDPATMSALIGASLRGVQASVIVPAKSDSRIVDLAARSFYRRLLEHDIRVFLYEGGMLHTKTLAVDGHVALIGTANFDRRSFEINFEVSLLAYDRRLAADLRRLQDAYIKQSRELTAHDPPWPVRLFENLVGLFSPLM